MRHWPLTGLLLLVSTQAISASHYHVRYPTYACVDPHATLELNDPARRHAALRAGMHRLGRCFRVRPRQQWEKIARTGHSLLLLRLKPPHAGEPPLYFKASSVRTVRMHRRIHAIPLHAQRRHGSHPLRAAFERAPALAFAAPLRAETGTQAPAPPHPSPAPRMQAPPLVPATAGAQTSIVSPPARADAAAAPGAGISPAQSQAGNLQRGNLQPGNLQPGNSRPAARVMRWLGPLLLWMLVIAAALLLVRLVLTIGRRPRGNSGQPFRIEPAWNPGQERLEPVLQAARYSGEAFARAAESRFRTRAPLDIAPRMAHAAEHQGLATHDDVPVGEFRQRCAAALRRAGWDARPVSTAAAPRADASGPDIIASSGGLLFLLRCHPSTQPLDAGAIEQVCLAHEQQRSDLVGIVSDAPFTDAASQRAERAGIILLHEDQLSTFTI